MKKICSAIFFAFLCLTSVAYGQPWAVISTYSDCTIQTVDLGTQPATVYGPFLAGQLGTSGLNDLAVTPDGKYAIVTSYYGGKVYRIDITDPLNTVLAGTISLPMITGSAFPYYYTPQDIAIAPNGQFAVISDGRSGNDALPVPPPTNMIAIIDLASFTFTTTYTLTTTQGSAQAVAIAPDNQTVILADRAGGGTAAPFPGRIIYGAINPSTGLTSESTLPLGNNTYPINVTISPDGQTVLISEATTDIHVFQITGPGVLVPGSPAVVSGLPGRQQSIVFSTNGQLAYALSTTPSPHKLSWLQVNGAGNVSLGGAGVATLFTSGNANRMLGTDVIALTPDGGFALVTNPSFTGDAISNNAALVDLSTFAVASVPTNSNYPMGVGIFLGTPSITTAEASEIKSTSAKSGGNIADDPIRPVTARGVCFSTSPNPTTADTCTTDGAGSGAFVSTLTGLTPNTPYYVRAYAVNSAGTAYGNEVTFATPEIPVAVPTLNEWGMILFATLMGVSSVYYLKRRRAEG